MDFVFGKYINDELKLVHHRTRRRGLQHDHAISPQDPNPGEPIALEVTCGQDLGCASVALYYTLDGSEPAGSRGVAARGAALAFERGESEWDVVAWSYLTRWRTTLPGQPDGTVLRYRIGGWRDGADEVFADWPDVTATGERAAQHFFAGEAIPEELTLGDPTGRTFRLHIDRLRPPAWAERAVIYQLFLDRFHPGDGRDWRQTDDLEAICGGTLWGVHQRIDYLADLGIDALWLSPTWATPSHHGYDVTDYDRTEPRLGGDEALRAVIDAAHDRGIRVLLDLVCNHISNHHPIFAAARSDPHSRYRDWFFFDDSPIGYRGFFGTPTMPELNLDHEPARDWMIGIAQRWLREFGVDGYRLDYATGPGPDFWAPFNAACKAVNPECFTFGEIVDAPDAIRRYAGRLDGSLDFQLNDALRKTYAYGSWSESAFERFLDEHRRFFSADFVLPTFLDSHDMDRFLFSAGGDREALKRAARRQFALAGPAIVYYGTEVGLQQRLSTRDEGLAVSRVPMVWGDEQDGELLAFYRSLIRERTGRP
jgi:hypothetical protein